MKISTLAVTVSIIANVLLAISTAALAYVNYMQLQENRSLEKDKATIQNARAAIETKLGTSEVVVLEQRERLRRSLDSFIKLYRSKIREIDDSLASYERFNTQDNRDEFGDGFANAWDQRFESVKEDLQALVAHVKAWRPAFDAFREMVNGEINTLESSIRRDDRSAMLEQLAIIQSMEDSRVALLDQALERAAPPQ